MQRLTRTTQLLNKRTTLNITKRFVTQYKDSVRSTEGKDAVYNQNPSFKEGTVKLSKDIQLPYKYVLAYGNKEFPLTSASITSTWDQQVKGMVNLESYNGANIQVFGFFPDTKDSSNISFICEARIKPVIPEVEHKQRVKGGSLHL
jgi:hypothetical protein